MVIDKAHLDGNELRDQVIVVTGAGQGTGLKVEEWSASAEQMTRWRRAGRPSHNCRLCSLTGLPTCLFDPERDPPSVERVLHAAPL